MRHEHSLTPSYFEAKFTRDPDPWGFETLPYETAKYDHTLAALDGRRYRRALEVGCANGVLTRRLSMVCDTLLALDVSRSALARARLRCADCRNVRFDRRTFPRDPMPEPSFNLIVLSEVAYYWDDRDLALAGRWLRHWLAPGADLVLVHWTGETDYPQTGDGAVAGLYAALADRVDVWKAERQPKYRLDVWRRR